MLLSLIAGLTMVCVLVVIHEAGHFVAAKIFGIAAPVFSVGMGPRLFGFEFRGTDYRISLLPVGGYVLLAGADPFGEEDREAQVDPAESFMKKPVWQRLIVMFAGPAANLVLPFVVFTAVLMAGEPQPDPSIGTVLPGSPAEVAGFEVGDVVTAVNGEAMQSWVDVAYALDERIGQDATLNVTRGGAEVALALPSTALQALPDGYIDLEALGLLSARTSTRVGVDDPSSPAALAGVRTGDAVISVDGQKVSQWSELRAALKSGVSHELSLVRPADGKLQELTVTLSPVTDWAPRVGDAQTDAWGLVQVQFFVGGLTKESAAGEAGVLAGDRLLSVDGEPVTSWYVLTRLVQASVAVAGPEATARSLALTVVRDGKVVPLSFTPRIVREVVRADVRWRPLMGIERFPDVYVAAPRIKRYHSLTEAVPRATEQGVEVFTSTVSVLANVFTGKFRFRESVGGPIAIFQVAAEGAKQGIFAYARLIGTISFSLGIINLLPVPVLDGGQILFYAIEGLRGRPLSLELRERVQMVGVLGLALLMLVVTVNDVSRWIGVGG